MDEIATCLPSLAVDYQLSKSMQTVVTAYGDRSVLSLKAETNSR